MIAGRTEDKKGKNDKHSSERNRGTVFEAHVINRSVKL
jgi:hypothetical protein